LVDNFCPTTEDTTVTARHAPAPLRSGLARRPAPVTLRQAMTESVKERAAELGERGTTTVDSGLSYLPGEPVTVLVRKREMRCELSDEGHAIALAGRPPGWRAAAQRVVDEAALNLARDGRIFVAVTIGRDLDELAARVATTSADVYDAVLDLQG
jgi:hypothetical protein